MPSLLSLTVGLALSAAPSDEGATAPSWKRPSLDELESLYGVTWKAELGRFVLLALRTEEWTRPCLSADGARAYVGTRTGRLEARSAQDGRILWSKPRFGDLGADMVEIDGVLLVGVDSDVAALSRGLGEERWRTRIGGRVGGPMAAFGRTVVVPVRPNGFVALDVETGERLWQVKRPTPDGLTIRGHAGPTIDSARDRVFLGFSDGALMGLELSTGRTLWTTPLGDASEAFADVDTTPVLVDGGRSVMAAGYNAGLFEIDASSGRVLSRVPVERITHLVRAGDRLVASTGKREVLGLTLDSEIAWRYRMRSGAPSAAAALDGGELVAVASSTGPLSILRARDGRPMQLIDTGKGASTPPAVAGRHMVLLSNGGLVLGLERGAPGGLLLR